MVSCFDGVVALNGLVIVLAIAKARSLTAAKLSLSIPCQRRSSSPGDAELARSAVRHANGEKAWFSTKVSAQMCPYCNRPLMKIDHYGEMLVGCIDCNRWGHPGDDKLVMELMPEDLSALKTIRQ